MSLLSDLRDAREFLGLGRDLVRLLLEIGRLLKGGYEQSAQDVLAIRIREQAAGKAANQASKNAGKTGKVS